MFYDFEFSELYLKVFLIWELFDVWAQLDVWLRLQVSGGGMTFSFQAPDPEDEKCMCQA